MKRFVEIDSTYRDRGSYPNPADFIVQYGSTKPSNLVDPITEQGPIYPAYNINPIAFYREYDDPITVADGTIMWRPYSPYVYTQSNGQLYVDELPLAPTSATVLTIVGNSTRNVYPLQQATNYYNNNIIENMNTQEYALVDSSSFTLGNVSLQTFLVESYFTDSDGFHVTVFSFNPNSYPPSNIDRYYQGKYLKVTSNSKTALILNYFINDSHQYQFDIDTNLSLSEGAGIEIVADRQTVVITSDTAFTSVIPPYPAFRFPTPKVLNTGKKITNISHNTADILHVRAVRHTDDTFGIAFLIADGSTSGGLDVGKLFYIASTDTEGIFFPNAETQVNLGGKFPLRNTNMGLIVESTYPRIIINTVDTTSSTGIIYNSTYVSAGTTNGSTWTSTTQVVTGATDGPVPTQTMNMAMAGPVGSNPAVNFFAETNGVTSGSGLLGYETVTSPPFTLTNLSSLFSGPPYDAIVKDVCVWGSNYKGILALQNDILWFVDSSWAAVVQVSTTLIAGQAACCNIRVPIQSTGNDAGFVYVTKNTNDLYFQYRLGSINVYPEVLVATDVSAEKLCKIIQKDDDGFPVIVYKALDGIRMIECVGYDTNISTFTWNDTILIDSIDTSTTLDVINGVDGNPYVVYNGPVSKLNVLSLGTFTIDKGVPYRLRSGSPLTESSYVRNGGIDTISVFDPLTTSYANQYVQVRTRQTIDYQQSNLARVALGIDINLMDGFPIVAYSNLGSYTTLPPPNATLYVAKNSLQNANGVWTEKNTGVTVAGTSLSKYSVAGIQGVPSVAYSTGTTLYFGYAQFPDTSGTWTNQLVGSCVLYTYTTLLEIENIPTIVFIGTGNAITIARRVSGTWSLTTTGITATGVVARLVNGFLSIAYFNGSNAFYATNSQTNGLGTWTVTTVYTGAPFSLNPNFYYPRIDMSVTKTYANIEEPFITYETATNGIVGLIYHNGAWTVETIHASITVGSMPNAGTIYNSPFIFYNDNALKYNKIARKSTTSGLWVTQTLDIQSAMDYVNISLIVNQQDIPLFAYNQSFSGGCNIVYGCQIITTPSQINDLRLILSNTFTQLRSSSIFTSNVYDDLFLSQVSFEILAFARDNYNPLVYNGSTVSQQQEVCYEVELQRLTLPNEILLTGDGNRIAFYPYIYVVFEPSNNERYNQIYTNNPNGMHALFSVGIYNVNTPDRAAFVVLDGRGMTQTIKTKPNTSFRFKVLLPNGDVFQVRPDTLPPIPPEFNLQISAVFSFKRVQVDKAKECILFGP